MAPNINKYITNYQAKLKTRTA